MKKVSPFVFVVLLLFSTPNLESRQYNVDYLMDLIESGNEEGVRQFFAQPKYVTKLKHIVEFTEIFREKLEERFGYKPSYKEAYELFKVNVGNMNFPEDQKKQLLSIFKEIVKQSEKANNKGYQLNSVTMDFRGSTDSDIDLPDELVIAYNEALGGALICIIPGGLPQLVGGGMILDAAKRTYDYIEKKGKKKEVQPEPFDYSDYGSSTEKDDYDRSHDHDSWDRASGFR